MLVGVSSPVSEVSGQRSGASTFAKRTAVGVLLLGAGDSEPALIGSLFSPLVFDCLASRTVRFPDGELIFDVLFAVLIYSCSRSFVMEITEMRFCR